MTEEQDESTIQEYSGWLETRTKLSHRWRKKWFCVKPTEMVYGKTAEGHLKTVPLVGSQIAESHVDKKQFAFRVKPKDKRRVHFLNAESEEMKNEWMQAICLAAVNKDDSNSQACIIQ